MSDKDDGELMAALGAPLAATKATKAAKANLDLPPEDPMEASDAGVPTEAKAAKAAKANQNLLPEANDAGVSTESAEMLTVAVAPTGAKAAKAAKGVEKTLPERTTVARVEKAAKQAEKEKVAAVEKAARQAEKDKAAHMKAVKTAVIQERVIFAHLRQLVQEETDPGQKSLLKSIMKRCDPITGFFKAAYSQINGLVGGRLYPEGGSLQNIGGYARRVISVPSWDIDMKNAHFMLLLKLCKDYGVACPVLQEYIEHRDEWLAEFIVDGDTEAAVAAKRKATKKEYLASLYGCQGTTPFPEAERCGITELSSNVIRIREEMQSIASFFEGHADFQRLKQAVAELKPALCKRKLEMTFMSYLLQRKEVEVLLVVKDHMEKAYPEVKIQSLIHDGIMFRKPEETPAVQFPAIETVLQSINKCSHGYGVVFELKPFERPGDFVPLGDLLTPTTDLEAHRFLLATYPDFLKMDGRVKMVYDPFTGMWSRNEFGSYIRLAAAAHQRVPCPYGLDRRDMSNAFELMIEMPNSAQFFEDARAAAKGKLLFTNCIYDKLTETRMAFTPDILFPVRVPHPLPDQEPEGVAEFTKWMFEDPFPEPGVGDYYLHELMRGVFGLGGAEALFHTGAGSNAKSIQWNGAVKRAFRDLIVSLDGKHLAVDKFSSSGAASPQLMAMMDARIVLVSEIAKEAVLNIALVKTLTGGDEVAGRQLYGSIVNFRCYCKLVFLANNIPAFSECGAEMLKRIHQLTSTVQFLLPSQYNPILLAKQQAFPGQDAVKLLEKSGIYLANEVLSERCKNNSAALIWLVVTKALARDVNDITPESVKVASLEVVAERDEVKKLFDEKYMRCADGRASTKSIQEALRIQAGGSGDRQLASRMRAWGFEPARVLAFTGNEAGEPKGSRSGYIGLKRKSRDDDDE